ncbi:MAG: hypothetical protein HYY14_06640, partial [Candidatus Omnitrophica bacterium]|nr:hypothetical protein [Candidatus Omnitrophota bacterium]
DEHQAILQAFEDAAQGKPANYFDLEKRLDALAKTSALAQATRERDEARKEKALLEHALAGLVNSERELREKLEDARRTVETVQRLSAALEEKSKDAQDAVEAKRSAQRDVIELGRYRRELEKSTRALENRQTELNVLEESLRTEHAGLVGQLSEFRGDLSDFAREKEEIYVLQAKLEIEGARVKEELNQAQAELDSANRELGEQDVVFGRLEEAMGALRGQVEQARLALPAPTAEASRGLEDAEPKEAKPEGEEKRITGLTVEDVIFAPVELPNRPEEEPAVDPQFVQSVHGFWNTLFEHEKEKWDKATSAEALPKSGIAALSQELKRQRVYARLVYTLLQAFAALARQRAQMGALRTPSPEELLQADHNIFEKLTERSYNPALPGHQALYGDLKRTLELSLRLEDFVQVPYHGLLEDSMRPRYPALRMAIDKIAAEIDHIRVVQNLMSLPPEHLLTYTTTMEVKTAYQNYVSQRGKWRIPQVPLLKRFIQAEEFGALAQELFDISRAIARVHAGWEGSLKAQQVKYVLGADHPAEVEPIFASRYGGEYFKQLTGFDYNAASPNHQGICKAFERLTEKVSQDAEGLVRFGGGTFAEQVDRMVITDMSQEGRDMLRDLAKRIELYKLSHQSNGPPAGDGVRVAPEMGDADSARGDGLTWEMIYGLFEEARPVLEERFDAPQIPMLPILTSAAAAPSPVAAGIPVPSVPGTGVPGTQVPHELFLDELHPALKSALVGHDRVVAFTSEFLSGDLMAAQIDIVAARLEAAQGDKPGQANRIWVVVPNGQSAGDSLMHVASLHENISILDEGSYIINKLDAELSGLKLIRAGFKEDQKVLDALEVTVPRPQEGEMVYLFNVFLAAFSEDPAFVDMVKGAASVWKLILEAGRSLVGPESELIKEKIQMQADALRASQA